MSFKAKLDVNGKQVNVLSCSYDLNQEVDATGRPSSVTRGGRIRLQVESTGDSSFFEWMVNNYERRDGTVSFLKRDTEARMKQLKFSEGYLVSYSEQFEATNEQPLSETFTISAREITVGQGTHVNEWV
ncbi:type VI secretion system tube protein TssD [Fodinibius sp.]|uniref:type VI secretion system tube protein TssD n=1 Tax=Fodinibius sp. TaxID=1872440 RepID=UPI003564A920